MWRDIVAAKEMWQLQRRVSNKIRHGNITDSLCAKITLKVVTLLLRALMLNEIWTSTCLASTVKSFKKSETNIRYEVHTMLVRLQSAILFMKLFSFRAKNFCQIWFLFRRGMTSCTWRTSLQACAILLESRAAMDGFLKINLNYYYKLGVIITVTRSIRQLSYSYVLMRVAGSRMLVLEYNWRGRSVVPTFRITVH